MVNILTYLFLSWDADLPTVSLFFHLILLCPKGIFPGTDKFNSYGLKQTSHGGLPTQPLLRLLGESQKLTKKQPCPSKIL